MGKGKAGADGYLGTDDTVATKEGGGEDVHRTTLSMGHTALTTEKLSEDTFDGTPTHDCKGMTPVGSDDTIFGCDTVFKTDRDGFLGHDEQTGGERRGALACPIARWQKPRMSLAL